MLSKTFHLRRRRCRRTCRSANYFIQSLDFRRFGLNGKWDYRIKAYDTHPLYGKLISRPKMTASQSVRRLFPSEIQHSQRPLITVEIIAWSYRRIIIAFALAPDPSFPFISGISSEMNQRIRAAGRSGHFFSLADEKWEKRNYPRVENIRESIQYKIPLLSEFLMQQKEKFEIG